ncbi:MULTISPECIES: branched-chain amino acid ABC transporter permease [Paenibacillus]|uniref:Leucine/isoleucine/valine transporter permease n=1 Tax=Paenibacillus naphthalenovorans TaxID=162209 RepID=A0A0U2W0G0_9BACL|nr:MULTISPECIES: branched-chain amino acid ABC transporter permease [Paenibacillus]ALS25191.1 leucine/isoleucine/valine transporter permease [Paenibacillus naphthalenovorans]NTZ20113.1 branched-chain amino acid ABC transporter permease [Paenibacillus sp. JMULE4]GCL73301.1 branched-chain amino acid ABC transporter permease [Paenibacillus naphthalenovorans]
MKTKTAVIALVSALAIGLIVPFIGAQNAYFYTVCSYILVWIILGQAWNLLGGFTGQISFGHAMFLGIGAYASMIFMNELNMDMFLSMALSALLAGLFSLPLGKLIFRLRGPYLGLGTLAMAEILLIIARNWKSVTNGGEGIMLESGGTFLGISVSDKQEYFFLGLALTVLVCLFISYLMKTKTGYSLIAIRENEDAAESMGIHAARYKSLSLFLSAAITGLGGSYYGLFNKFIDPEMAFTVHLSAEMIFVTVIGGIGTIAGPIIGSTLLIGLQEYLKGIPALQTYPSLYLVIYGLMIMAVIVYLPGGMVDGIKKWMTRMKKRRGEPHELTENRPHY